MKSGQGDKHHQSHNIDLLLLVCPHRLVIRSHVVLQLFFYFISAAEKRKKSEIHGTNHDSDNKENNLASLPLNPMCDVVDDLDD